MLKIRVKASQITNLTDARYFAAREVEWLGFNLDAGTENFVHPLTVKSIQEWVEGPKIVGEFGLQDTAEILQTVEFLNLDGIQTGMFSDALPFSDKEIPVIKEIVIERGVDYAELTKRLESDARSVDIFLLNYSKNKIPWSMVSPESNALKDMCGRFKILLGIDFTPPELEEILLALPIYGLNLKGDEEEKIGFKSFDELDEIFDLLEME